VEKKQEYGGVNKSTGALISWIELDKEQIELVKPQKFMNQSGATIKGIIKKHPQLRFEEIYVVYDDLDMRLGEYKIVFGKGPKVHNGLRSIYEQLGTNDFWHVRLGIDNRQVMGYKGTGEGYVLSKWLEEERQVIEKVIEKVVEELKNVFA